MSNNEDHLEQALEDCRAELAAEREKSAGLAQTADDYMTDIESLGRKLDLALAAQKAAEERAEKSWNTAVETCARYAEDYERDERGRSTFIGERIADTLRREVRLAPQAPAAEPEGGGK